VSCEYSSPGRVRMNAMIRGVGTTRLPEGMTSLTMTFPGAGGAWARQTAPHRSIPASSVALRNAAQRKRLFMATSCAPATGLVPKLRGWHSRTVGACQAGFSPGSLEEFSDGYVTFRKNSPAQWCCPQRRQTKAMLARTSPSPGTDPVYLGKHSFKQA